MTRTRYRWFIIFLLFAITVVNYIDRAAISYAIPLMQRDLGLSPADTGIILGAFGLGYAITTLIGGFAVDRYGARVVLAVAAILWSLSIGATGFASGFTFPYAARRVPAAGPVGRTKLPGPHRSGQPLAFAARAGDRLGLRLAGRAAGACDRRPHLHGASRLAPLAPHFRGPVHPVDRLGATVVFPVPRRSGGVPLRQCRRARPYPDQRPLGLRRTACRREILARARCAQNAADQQDTARQHLGLLRLRLLPVLLHDLAAELPGAGLWPQPADRRSVHGAALACGRGPAVAARALVGPSAEDDGPAARRSLLSHRRQPVRRGAG